MLLKSIWNFIIKTENISSASMPSKPVDDTKFGQLLISGEHFGECLHQI